MFPFLLVPALLSACGEPEGLPAHPSTSGAGSTGWPWMECKEADDDLDGVPRGEDCDDGDPTLGALLYRDGFSTDTGWLTPTPQLPDPWDVEGGWIGSPGGGQQAVLGPARTWGDVAVFATLSSEGTEEGCEEGGCTSDRWRSGILVRASLDGDQGEGFHGFRCALAKNAVDDCYPEGHFLQIGEFKDAPEDDVASECQEGAGCPNPTFDSLARVDHSPGLDLSAGQVITMAFYAVGPDLWCSVAGGPSLPVVTATATSPHFPTGTVGLSTLDLLGTFDSLQVCEALEIP